MHVYAYYSEAAQGTDSRRTSVFSNSELTPVKTATIAHGCPPVALATAEAETKAHGLKGQTKTSKASYRPSHTEGRR